MLYTHTHTHTCTFRKIIAGIIIVIILFVIISIFIVQQKDSIVLADNQTKKLDLQDNEHMHLEVDSSGDKVPVPNGYVGSKATGENEIDTGYVIYEGEEVVTDSNVEEAQKTRNQYVWVPVPDASTMYGTDANGKKWGKLYDFTIETGDNIDEITGAKPLNWSENKGIIEVASITSYREPDVVIKGVNTIFDIDSELKVSNIKSKNTHEFLIELEQEFNNMIESVEKYGGFYVGRYETGDLSKEAFVVKKGNTDITNQNWYSMYIKSKKLKQNNTNIETGIIWGSQWDRTLCWLVESGNRTKEEICEDSKTWGNYITSSFEYINSNGNIETKNIGSIRRIPTGSTEYTKANNIYDLAGNLSEWTMESYGNSVRIGRGGYNGGSNVSSYRHELRPNTTNSSRRLPSNVIHKIRIEIIDKKMSKKQEQKCLQIGEKCVYIIKVHVLFKVAIYIKKHIYGDKLNLFIYK